MLKGDQDGRCYVASVLSASSIFVIVSERYVVVDSHGYAMVRQIYWNSAYRIVCISEFGSSCTISATCSMFGLDVVWSSHVQYGCESALAILL